MINSKEYWDKRFVSGDWIDHGGREQTLFFANLAISNLPKWLTKQINKEHLTICDMGCAEGDAVDLFAKLFFNCDVTGIDFSESAIHRAKINYPSYVFQQGDINTFDKEYDVIFSSNTLEHFRKPDTVLNKMLSLANKYLILLVPFNEMERIDEHLSSFFYDSFLLRKDKYVLLYYKEIDCTEIENSMWPGQEILVVYGNVENIAYSSMTLDNLNNNNYDQLIITHNLLKSSYEAYSGLEVRCNKEIFDLNENLTQTASKLSETELKLSETELKLSETDLKLLHADIKAKDFESELYSLKKELSDKQTEITDLNNTINELQKKNSFLEVENLAQDSKFEVENLKAELNNIYNSDFWKLAKAYYRLIDKVTLLRKLRSFLKRIKNTKRLKNINSHSNSQKNMVYAQEKENPKEKSLKYPNLPFYNYFYNKTDIILLSVIDWDFRFQRPQQLAKAFAEDGHRVFYFDANFLTNESKITDIMDNLKVVRLNRISEERIYDIKFEDHLSLTLAEIDKLIYNFNIRECTVIVEYPNWEPIAKHLKDKYSFKVLFDYIDDYTGFETNNPELARYCSNLFKTSDLVISTSQFLYQKAKQDFDRVEIVRNGTEYEHFNIITPERINTARRPIIGYYGALAEWFDIEKICYIAGCRPEWDIWLIGNVSYDGCNELIKFKNVKFFGEKSYDELPAILVEFDVCLIPFKADIDLIKATNPVKFYEYLSAGKKVVATEIPELIPFKNKYAYLANDKEKFLEYVSLCVDGKDTLESADVLRDFAEKQDWKYRYLDMYQHIKELYGKVSIVIVTYNNIELTKMCINSILQKTAYPNYEIIIVDNNSSDNTKEYLTEIEGKYSNIKVILSDVNTGFAKGNNIGISNSDGEYVILLNNDTIVTRGWITGLIKHLSDEIGMIGPVTNSIGNEAMINVDYTNVADMDLFAFKYTSENFGRLYNSIPVLAMFCIALKREILNEVGLLDESYGIGMFEDDDYSYGIRSKGYRVACAEDVFIHHFGRASFKKLDDTVYRDIFETNKKLFETKWNVMWVPHKYRDGVTLK